MTQNDPGLGRLVVIELRRYRCGCMEPYGRYMAFWVMAGTGGGLLLREMRSDYAICKK